MSQGKGGISFNVEGFLAKRRRIVEREITWAGRNMQRDTVQRMRAPGKSGRVYLSRGAGFGRKGGDYAVRNGRRIRLGKRYTASAPGQAPAVDIGELVTHVAYSVKESAWRFRAVMGITSGNGGNAKLLLVAMALETGAKFKRRRGGIDPRPSWTPALKTEGPLFQQRLFRSLRDAARG